MDDRSRAELAALRARAYGPAADIDADPAALARLRELEDAAHVADPTARAAGTDPRSRDVDAAGEARAPDDPFAPVPVQAPAAGTVESVVASDGAGPPADGPARLSRPRRRRVGVLWPLSVAATVLLTAVVITGVVPPRSADPRAPLVLTRPASPLLTVAVDMADQRVVAFHGVTIVKFTVRGGPSNGDTCLVLVERDAPAADAGPGDGIAHEGCSAGPLPPVMQFTVDEGDSRLLRARYPTGTGLRFTVDGDGTRVWVDVARPAG